MYRNYIKYIIDFLIALIALTIFLPVLIPVSICLILTGEHNVFYFQQRIGYKNRSFFIWKFATMLKNSPNMGTGLHTLRKDSRVLPMGHFLRKTKINELPQIVNILKGDMSIVGPRPLVNMTFEPYPDHVKRSVYNIKPGLTGIGSIVFRDEERLLSETSMPIQDYYKKFISPYKGELEMWYQEHISFKTDILLIFLTVWVIFYPKSDLAYRIFKDLPERLTELN